MKKMKTDSRLPVSNADTVLKITVMNSGMLQERMNHKVKNVTQTLDNCYYSPMILTKTLFGLLPSNSP